MSYKTYDIWLSKNTWQTKNCRYNITIKQKQGDAQMNFGHNFELVDTAEYEEFLRLCEADETPATPEGLAKDRQTFQEAQKEKE